LCYFFFSIFLHSSIFTGRLPWQPDGIKFTQCVSDQKSAFSPLHEKLCVGSKNAWHLLELSRRSLSACKVWGDRTTRAGCRSENWCFLYVTLGLPARGGHSSNKYCVTVYGSILMAFSAIFSEAIALSGALHGSHLCRQVAPQYSRNCRQKLRKVQKICRKVCAHHSTSYR